MSRLWLVLAGAVLFSAGGSSARAAEESVRAESLLVYERSQAMPAGEISAPAFVLNGEARGARILNSAAAAPSLHSDLLIFTGGATGAAGANLPAVSPQTPLPLRR